MLPMIFKDVEELNFDCNKSELQLISDLYVAHNRLLERLVALNVEMCDELRSLTKQIEEGNVMR